MPRRSGTRLQFNTYALATRVERRSRFHYDGWMLDRYAEDPTTDLWFWVGRAWTRRGAARMVARFIDRMREDD